jgi:hypothetical protein
MISKKRPHSCSECDYWLENTKQTKDNRRRGECRKSEPSLGPDGYGYWPLTIHNEYCFSGKISESMLNEDFQE